MRKEVSCHSFTDESELPPRPLSIDEAEHLDQECFERFIKINSHYITEHMVSLLKHDTGGPLITTSVLICSKVIFVMRVLICCRLVSMASLSIKIESRYD